MSRRDITLLSPPCTPHPIQLLRRHLVWRSLIRDLISSSPLSEKQGGHVRTAQPALAHRLFHPPFLQFAVRPSHPYIRGVCATIFSKSSAAFLPSLLLPAYFPCPPLPPLPYLTKSTLRRVVLPLPSAICTPLTTPTGPGPSDSGYNRGINMQGKTICMQR